MIFARSWPTVVVVRSMLWRMRFLDVRYSNDLITRMVKVAAVLGARVLDSGSLAVGVVIWKRWVWVGDQMDGMGREAEGVR